MGHHKFVQTAAIGPVQAVLGRSPPLDMDRPVIGTDDGGRVIAASSARRPAL